MNKKKPTTKSAAKSRKPGVNKDPMRDLGLSRAEAGQVKGGITVRKAGETQQ